jgi:ABC-type Mn2+/Zn2+ transport system ATPase subunit
MLSSTQGALVITVRGLNIGYKREIVVPNVNFQLSKGEAIALIGTNGSGKSTLLKTIVGLIPKMSGDITVLNKPPGSESIRTAYLGQFHPSAFILPIRAIDIVRMGRFPEKGLCGRMNSKDDDIVHNAMKRMGVANLADKPMHSLSGGQQQRTYLAQVLAHQAELLVLDEPTSGLDAGGRELYLRALKEEMGSGVSIVMATHDIEEEARICSQVVLLARKVVAIGSPSIVMTPENLFSTFGVVIAGEKHLHLLENPHGHDESGHTNPQQHLH